MAKFIGVVSKVVGQVFAVDSDGSRRLLVEGDRLYAGEQLETGNAGAIAVRLDNGAELTLGRDSSLQMSPQPGAADRCRALATSHRCGCRP